MRDLSARQRMTRRLTIATLCLALWAVLVMLTLKLLVGWATHSLALFGTALHTLVTTFVLLIGLQREHVLGKGGARAKGSPGPASPLEIGSIFLMWALLGFGSFNLLGFLGSRWQISGNLPVEPPIVSLALVQLIGLMGGVSLAVTLVIRYMASTTANARLSGHAALLLKESWLNLLVLCGLLAVRQGQIWIDSVLGLVGIALAVGSGWQRPQRVLPQLFQAEAIAPEAIVQPLQRIDGVLRCIPLRSQGLVGRHVRIDLQLLIHPEYESRIGSIVQRSSMALQHRYGPADVNIELINPDGSPRQRISAAEIRELAALDFWEWN